MTFLGKLFVMVNVAMSLFMAFAAFGLYVNGVDWGYDVAKPGQAGGVLKERQDEIKELAGMVAPTEKAWRTERAKLWATEDARRADVAFYARELEHNRLKATPDNNPAKAVVLETFRPKRVKGLPEMTVAKARGDKEKEADLPPLGSRSYFEAQLKAKQEENLKILADIEKQVQEGIKLTKQIYDKETGRGLRTDLVDERVKRQGVLRERQLVAPLYVNTAVESELSKKRLDTMEARIKELEAYIEKRGLDPKKAKR